MVLFSLCSMHYPAAAHNHELLDLLLLVGKAPKVVFCWSWHCPCFGTNGNKSQIEKKRKICEYLNVHLITRLNVKLTQ